MKLDKRIMILAASAVCLAAVVLAQRKVFSVTDVNSRPLGYPLWEKPLALDQVVEVVLEGGGKTCRLHKGPDHWQVKDRYDYCADFQRLTKLLRKIGRLKVGYSFAADRATLERLHLEGPPRSPTAKGIRIIMRDANAKTIADLVIGRQRQAAGGSGGQFVRQTGQDTVYLVDETFHLLNPGPEYWIQDDLVSIQPGHIRQVEAYDASGNLVYRIDRPDPSRPAVLEDVPPGRKVSPAKIDQLFDALNPLKVADILGTAPAGAAKGPRLVFHLKGGTCCTVYLLAGKNNDLYRLLLHAEPCDRKSGARENPVSGCAALADPAVWLYGVEKWQFESFFTTAEQLLEPQ